MKRVSVRIPRFPNEKPKPSVQVPNNIRQQHRNQHRNQQAQRYGLHSPRARIGQNVNNVNRRINGRQISPQRAPARQISPQRAPIRQIARPNHHQGVISPTPRRNTAKYGAIHSAKKPAPLPPQTSRVLGSVPADQGWVSSLQRQTSRRRFTSAEPDGYWRGPLKSSTASRTNVKQKPGFTKNSSVLKNSQNFVNRSLNFSNPSTIKGVAPNGASYKAASKANARVPATNFRSPARASYDALKIVKKGDTKAPIRVAASSEIKDMKTSLTRHHAQVKKLPVDSPARVVTKHSMLEPKVQFPTQVKKIESNRSLLTVNSAQNKENQMKEKIVYVEKPVEKLVYVEKPVEKIVYVDRSTDEVIQDPTEINRILSKKQLVNDTQTTNSTNHAGVATNRSHGSDVFQETDRVLPQGLKTSLAFSTQMKQKLAFPSVHESQTINRAQITSPTRLVATQKTSLQVTQKADSGQGKTPSSTRFLDDMLKEQNAIEKKRQEEQRKQKAAKTQAAINAFKNLTNNNHHSASLAGLLVGAGHEMKLSAPIQPGIQVGGAQQPQIRYVQQQQTTDFSPTVGPTDNTDDDSYTETEDIEMIDLQEVRRIAIEEQKKEREAAQRAALEQEMARQMALFQKQQQQKLLEEQRRQRILQEQQRQQKILEEQQRQQQILAEQQRQQQILAEQQRQQKILEEQQRQQQILEEQKRQQKILEEQRKQQQFIEDQRKQQQLLEEQTRKLVEEQSRRDQERIRLQTEGEFTEIVTKTQPDGTQIQVEITKKLITKPGPEGKMMQFIQMIERPVIQQTPVHNASPNTTNPLRSSSHVPVRHSMEQQQLPQQVLPQQVRASHESGLPAGVPPNHPNHPSQAPVEQNRVTTTTTSQTVVRPDGTTTTEITQTVSQTRGSNNYMRHDHDNSVMMEQQPQYHQMELANQAHQAAQEAQQAAQQAHQQQMEMIAHQQQMQLAAQQHQIDANQAIIHAQQHQQPELHQHQLQQQQQQAYQQHPHSPDLHQQHLIKQQQQQLEQSPNQLQPPVQRSEGSVTAGDGDIKFSYIRQNLVSQRKLVRQPSGEVEHEQQQAYHQHHQGSPSYDHIGYETPRGNQSMQVERQQPPHTDRPNISLYHHPDQTYGSEMIQQQVAPGNELYGHSSHYENQSVNMQKIKIDPGHPGHEGVRKYSRDYIQSEHGAPQQDYTQCQHQTEARGPSQHYQVLDTSGLGRGSEAVNTTQGHDMQVSFDVQQLGFLDQAHFHQQQTQEHEDMTSLGIGDYSVGEDMESVQPLPAEFEMLRQRKYSQLEQETIISQVDNHDDITTKGGAY